MMKTVNMTHTMWQLERNNLYLDEGRDVALGLIHIYKIGTYTCENLKFVVHMPLLDLVIKAHQLNVSHSSFT